VTSPGSQHAGRIGVVEGLTNTQKTASIRWKDETVAPVRVAGLVLVAKDQSEPRHRDEEPTAEMLAELKELWKDTQEAARLLRKIHELVKEEEQKSWDVANGTVV